MADKIAVPLNSFNLFIAFRFTPFGHFHMIL